MRRILRMGLLSIFLVVSLSLTGCKSSDQKATQSLKSTNSEVSQTPETIKPQFYYKDSAEKRLVQLEQHLKKIYSEQFKTLYYQYNYADLNEDFSNEILVWLSINNLSNPGQSTQQFIIMDEQFNTIFRSELVKAPISVLTQKTNGWLDIAYFEGKAQYHLVKMNSNGKNYTLSSNENVIEFDDLEGVCYLSNAINEIGFQIK